MSEESKEQEVEPMVLPDTEDIPEKFRGKDVNEVLKSYHEVEKLIGSKGEEIGGLKKELELMREQSQPEPEEEQPAMDSYDYMTKGDVAKMLSEQQKNFDDQLKKASEGNVAQTNWEFDKRQFSAKHPELDEKAVNTIALIGIENGENTLDGAYEHFVQFASKAGLNANAKDPRIVSSNLSGVPNEEQEKSKEMFSDDWMKRARTGARGISDTFK